jgi:hypothetical protein
MELPLLMVGKKIYKNGTRVVNIRDLVAYLKRTGGLQNPVWFQLVLANDRSQSKAMISQVRNVLEKDVLSQICRLGGEGAFIFPTRQCLFVYNSKYSPRSIAAWLFQRCMLKHLESNIYKHEGRNICLCTIPNIVQGLLRRGCFNVACLSTP